MTAGNGSACNSISEITITRLSGIPCPTACHGPGPRDLAGFGGEDLEGRFPPLAGQDEAYLITQLRLWRDGVRGGTEAYNLMRVAAQELEEEEIEALAGQFLNDPVKVSVGALLVAQGLNVAIRRDLAGLDRCVIATRT